MPKKGDTSITNVIPEAVIVRRIFWIRKEKVMLDADLASLYDVETKTLKRAVKRNKERFPEDFMFELTKEEWENLRYQFGTSSWGGTRYPPYAFTEQGVAMLSSVLNSKRAIAVNIQIIRTFTHLRKLLLTHEELRKKITSMEKKYDKQFRVVFVAMEKLLKEKDTPRRKIGYRT